MGMRSTTTNWGLGVRVLHWSMALLLVGMLALGMVMVDYPLSLWKLKLYAFHKALGFSLFLLVAVRLFWRLVDSRPTPPDEVSARYRSLARVAHVALYGLMILLPLTGLLYNSAAGFPLNWFGLAKIPALIEANEAVQLWAGTAHYTLGLLLSVLVLLHVAAALRHHFLLRDGVLRRMLIGRGGQA